MRKITFVAIALLCAVVHGKELNNFLYAAEPKVGSGRYFGSQSPLNDDSFRLCRELTENATRPLIVLWAQNPTTFNSLVTSLNAEYTSNQSWGASKNCLFTIFYGTSRQAEREAYEFVKSVHGDPGGSGVCVCYGVGEDKIPIDPTSKVVSSLSEFKGAVGTYVTMFNKEVEKHHSIPQASNAKFAVEDGELKATVDTTQVYVPMVRVAKADTAENEWIVADYPDGTVATNGLHWASGDLEGKVREVRIDLDGRLLNVGEKVWLYHLNTNKIAVATNSITCIERPLNAIEFPRLPGEVESLDAGDWSLDGSLIDSYSNNVARLRQDAIDLSVAYDNATNVLFYAEVTNDMATTAYNTATGELAKAQAGFLSASNTLSYAVVTNDTATDVYIDATNALAEAQFGFLGASNTLYNAESTNDTATAAYIDATNALAEAIVAYDGATNYLHYAGVTNETATTAYINATNALAEAIVAYDGVTNYLYYVGVTNETATAAYIAATNDLAEAIAVYDGATNHLYYAGVTNETATTAYIDATNALAEAQAEYVAASNELANAAIGTPDYYEAEQRYIIATNALYYAVVTNNLATNAYDIATNALAEAIAAYDVATNTLFYAGMTNDTATTAYIDATNALAEAQSGFLDASNTLYNAESTNDAATAAYIDATNALAEAIVAHDGATSCLHYAEVTNDTAMAAYIDATNALAKAIIAYDGATNYLYHAGVTNTLATEAYVIATNALAEAIAAYDGATNCLYCAGVTNDMATVAYIAATNNLSNAVATTNMAYNAYVGKTNELAHAESEFIIVVSGSVVGNVEMGMISALFNSGEYREWALLNNVRNIVLDCPANATNSWSGASLFTYDTPAGVEFLSANGISPGDATRYSNMVKDEFEKRRRDLASAGVPEVLLLRADGSYVGQLVESRIENTKLKPAQKYQEEYNIEENICRLSDLIKLSAFTNDVPSSIAYGESTEFMLQVNCPKREFTVVGLPANTYFDLDLTVPELVSNANFRAEFQSWNRNPSNEWNTVKPEKRNTWRLNEGDLSTNDYRVVLSAYTEPRYEIYGGDTDFIVAFRFVPMQPDAGKIGFTETARKITEGSVTSVDIVVERTEWHSGSVTGYLAIVEGEGGTTAKPYRFSWPTNEVGEYVEIPLVWEDGEWTPPLPREDQNGRRTYSLQLNNDTIWDDDEKIVVALIGLGEHEVDFGAVKYTLTIVEDDTKSVGRIGFSADAPDASPFAKGGVIYAKENTDVLLGVERIGGASGFASVGIKTTGGEVRTKSLSWTDKDTEVVKYARITMPSLESGQQQSTIYVSLVRNGEAPLIASASRVQIRVLPSGAPEFQDANVTVLGVQTKTVEKTIKLAGEIPDGASVTLSRSSGTVPAGVTVKYDRDINALVVSGVPSGYGYFSATYQVVVRSGGKTMYSMPVAVGFALVSRAVANAFVATARVFKDLPVVDTNANRLVGLIDVTLPVNGRHTAKFRSAAGKTVSFTANGWDSLAPDAAVADFSSRIGMRLSFSVSETGAVTATLFDPDACESFGIVRPAGETWSAANPADGYQGNYAVRLVPEDDGSAPLCTGAAALSLRMNGVGAVRTGKMTFAGTLPNGRSISGTAVLTESADATSASLPILSVSASDNFTSVLTVINGSHLSATTFAQQAVWGTAECAAAWDHVEKRLPDEYSYSVRFSAQGSYIPSGLNWEDQLKRDCGTATLAFSIPGIPGATAISASGKALKIADAKSNQLGVAIRTFNATTGVLSGTAKVDGKTFSWCGALVPDWGRPTMQGACWRNESGVKVGMAVRLDIAE